MIGIFIAKLTWLYRNPGMFLVMIIMSILFALITGGSNLSKVSVPSYTSGEQENDIVHLLEEQDVFMIEWVQDVSEIDGKVKNGKNEFGLILDGDDFQIVVGVDSLTVSLFEQFVRGVFIKQKQFNLLETLSGVDDVKEELLQHPAFTIDLDSFHGKDAVPYDGKLHPLFGFTLFFVIYTIAYSVLQILQEKRKGVWDRMILSPVGKWEMYVANFLYSFLVGYVQVLIVFFVFRFIVKVDFHGTFLLTLLLLIPYVLTIVALSIFITGIVKTVQQFNAVIPIVSVASAMIGGAFWPLEIVQSTFMLTLSKFVPMTYGMELLNGITMYDYSSLQLLYPMSILLLMTVVFTGLGIHLMEKRYVS